MNSTLLVCQTERENIPLPTTEPSKLHHQSDIQVPGHPHEVHGRTHIHHPLPPIPPLGTQHHRPRSQHRPQASGSTFAMGMRRLCGHPPLLHMPYLGVAASASVLLTISQTFRIFHACSLFHAMNGMLMPSVPA